MSTRGEIKSVVFDLGGVLIDWNPRYLYRRLFSTEGEMEYFLAEVCTPEWNRELDRGRSFSEATAALQARYPRYAIEIEAYRVRWPEMLGGPIEGTVEILEELRERGYSLYALTNFSAEAFPVARGRYGFLEYFEEIVVSGEEGMVKPDPGIYTRLIDRTGLDPAAALFVDDLPENVVAAEGFGFTGVTFRDPAGLRRNLRQKGLLQP